MADKFTELLNDPYYADAIKTINSLQGSSKEDPNRAARIAALQADIEKGFQPKPSMIKEGAKSIGRAALNVGKLAARTAQGGALDLGAVLGYSPEENKVAQTAQEGANYLESFSAPEGALARNPEFEKEHPILSTVQDVGEGAAPWLVAGAATEATGGALGPLILPAAAALSHQGESVERQMKKGVSGNEALVRSIPGATTNAVMFALMPKVMNKMKGTINPVTGEVTEGILGTPARGVAKGALQGLAADAPYLLAQGELSQGADVAAGAVTGEEWKQGHTLEAIKKNLIQTAVTGAGFGALHGAKTPKVKPITDDKTPVDITKAETPVVETTPELKTQGILDLQGVKTRQTPESLLPEGSREFNYTKGKDIAKQLKSLGIQPIIEDLGIDVLGNRKMRVSLPQEVDTSGPMSSLDHQYEFDFNKDVNKDVPLRQMEFDLTGSANKPLPQVPKSDINQADARNELAKFGLSYPDLETRIEMPTHYTAESNLEYAPKEQLGLSFEAPTIAEKASKSKKGSKVKVEVNKPIVELPEVAPLAVEPLVEPKVEETKAVEVKPEVKQRKVKEKQPVEFDIKSAIQDFMTNPESKFKAEQFTELGKSVEELNAAREYNLKKIQEESAKPIETQPTKEVTELPKEVLKPKKEVIKKINSEEVAAKAAEEMGIKASGKEVIERLKKEVGSTTPEEEARHLQQESKEGWKDNDLARTLAQTVHEEGLITNRIIEEALKESYEDYPHKARKDVKGNVKKYYDKERIQKYKDQALGVLSKGVEDGVLVKRKDGYEVAKGVNIKKWYKDNILNRGGNNAKGLERRRVASEFSGEPDHNVKITAEDKQNMEQAYKDYLARNAQKPHRVYAVRMNKFKKVLQNLNREIVTSKYSTKKVPKLNEFGEPVFNPKTKKPVLETLTKKYTRLLDGIKEQWKSELGEGHYDRLKKDAEPTSIELIEVNKAIKELKAEKKKDYFDDLSTSEKQKLENKLSKLDSRRKELNKILGELKKEARDIGRLPLEEGLKFVYDELAKGDVEINVKDYESIIRSESHERQRASDLKTLDDLKRGTDEEVRLSADAILELRDNEATNKAYADAKNKTERTKILRNAINEAYSRISGGIVRGAPIEKGRPVVQEYAGGNLAEDRIMDSEIATEREKAQARLAEIKAKQQEKANKAAVKVGQESIPEAKARLEEEERLRIKKEEYLKAREEEEKALRKEQAKFGKYRQDWSEGEATVSGHTIESVKEELGKDASRVDVIQSQEDLPPIVRAQMKEDGVGAIEGYYDRNSGKIVLVADNIEKSEGVVQRVFAHEITHHGIQSLGKRGEQLLNQIYMAHKAEIDGMVSSKTDKLDRANEFIARFGETNLKPSLMKKVMDFIKDIWTRAIGKTPTDKDLRDFMKEIRNSLSQETKGVTGIDYSESKFKPIENHIERVKEIFDPERNEGMVAGLTKYFNEYFNENGLVKGAIKGLLRPAYWDNNLRDASVNMNKSIETKSMLQHKFRGDDNKGLNDIKALSMRDIASELGKIPQESRKNTYKAIVLADQLEKAFDTLEEVRKQEGLENFTKEEFDMYNKYRAFNRQFRNKSIAEFANGAAYTISDVKEMLIPIREAIQNKALQTEKDFINFFENHRSIKDVGLDKLVSKIELKAILTQLMDKEGVRAKYKEISGNYGEHTMDWYMPRERLEGGEWVVEMDKVDSNGVKTKVFNQAFYNKMEADILARDLKANPTKYVPANFKGLQDGESLHTEGIRIKRIDNKDRFGYKDDQSISDMVDKVLQKNDISDEERREVVHAVRQEILNKLLEQHGQKHIIKRKNNLIEGYNEDSPFDAIETQINRTANSFAKMQYVTDQMRLLENIEAEKKPEFKEYVRQTLKPVQFGGRQAQYLKNATAIYFMGFRPLTALMQLTQLHTVGAAELGMHLKGAGIKAPAQALLAKAGKDVIFGNLSKAEKEVMRVAEDVGATFENSSQASLFSGLDDGAVRTRFGKRLAKVSDKSMEMFKMAEAYNRKAAILASYRVFAKGKTTFDRVAFDKAIEFNNNTNFMLNKGNIPYMFMHNPLGMSAYSLMSYTLNMSNWLFNRFHGTSSDLSVGKWEQRKAFVKFLGYTAVLAGASGLPFVDDLNKAIRKFSGRDMKRETEQFIKKNMGNDISDLVSSGIFAPMGYNITNNMSIRVPFVSGLLDDKGLAESAFGASGAMVMKGANAYSALMNGEGRKFAEAITPEVLSGALRAERMYRQGQRDATGKPVMYQGKPFKLGAGEALTQGVLGLKSQRRAEMMDTVDSEMKLKKYWEEQKKLAMKRASEGDKNAIPEFHKEVIKNKAARLLVKPITGAAMLPKKEKAGKVAFELG